jgi:hypothetical protein
VQPAAVTTAHAQATSNGRREGKACSIDRPPILMKQPGR